MESIEDTLRRLLLVLLVTMPIALAVSLASGWFLAGRALRPVDAITLAAQRIAAGDLSQRVCSILADIGNRDQITAFALIKCLCVCLGNAARSNYSKFEFFHNKKWDLWDLYDLSVPLDYLRSLLAAMRTLSAM